MPQEQQSEYTEYKPDGTFCSMEGKMIIKGKWMYNSSLQTITITQNVSRNYPGEVVTKVVRLDEDRLILSSEDAGGDFLKIHMVHRK